MPIIGEGVLVMSEEQEAMMELPKYQCHKRVWALKISGIEFHKDKSATVAVKDEGYAPFKTRPEWYDRFKGGEDDLGYYVVYEEGYSSWSPTAVFESGYTQVK